MGKLADNETTAENNTDGPGTGRFNRFYNYTDQELLNYNTAVMRLYDSGEQKDEHTKQSIIDSGAEMTRRKLW